MVDIYEKEPRLPKGGRNGGTSQFQAIKLAITQANHCHQPFSLNNHDIQPITTPDTAEDFFERSVAAPDCTTMPWTPLVNRQSHSLRNGGEALSLLKQAKMPHKRAEQAKSHLSFRRSPTSRPLVGHKNAGGRRRSRTGGKPSCRHGMFARRDGCKRSPKGCFSYFWPMV